MKARSITQQGRLDTFFSISRTVTTTTPAAKKTETAVTPNKGLKRKAGATTDAKAKGKAGGGSAKKPKIKATNVLRHELETLKPGRKVYIQQPGSLVFFKGDKDTALKNCHENLKSLQRENQQLESKMDQTS
ncbi:unnamed protein product [Adineta steineri]|uniref:Uncharacterized protein n=1 Tax=Adineta steineri TaxID=433720 RepID=A0A818RV99_9BILA|nr:unnamed protein product [Adineta steineri]CAF1419338.1 unnamed protein product [Adineta steineri]CAF3656298.1 unnamed protein product [Adineta steineri]CAF3754634.1 unnamed protein product [Adineta steineri]